jgi:hypothetical protein
MTVAWTHESDPILALARELSSAMASFQEVVRQEFQTYQQGVGDKHQCTTDFLRSIHLADAAYYTRARTAHESYRARLESSLVG